MATLAQSTPSAPSPSVVREVPIVDSSWLTKIKYDPSIFQLTITTKRGDEYVHFMVYPAMVDQMLQAPSKGKFYADNIKGKGLSNRVITKATGKPLRNPAKGPTHTTREAQHGR